MSGDPDNKSAFVEVISSASVEDAARNIRAGEGEPQLGDLLELARALAEAVGDVDREGLLRAELAGYEVVGAEIPQRRRVTGFASAFPVRAIGLLEPEEIFIANREKFSQVMLTIGQSVTELETALAQIREGGVLALRVPASEVSGDAIAGADAEVYIYILPREIERLIEQARSLVLDSLLMCLVNGVLGPRDERTTAATGPFRSNVPTLASELEGISVDDLVDDEPTQST